MLCLPKANNMCLKMVLLFKGISNVLQTQVRLCSAVSSWSPLSRCVEDGSYQAESEKYNLTWSPFHPLD